MSDNKRISQIKVQDFEQVLLDFLQKAGREYLPWRREGISAYEVWVSEIMLQQTQVSRVVDYYERFLDRFPTVKDLARASWEEFLPYYAGLGYYNRGRNMLRTAQMIVSDSGGVFPKEVSELEKLPGIGTYTASAIASFAYGKNILAWDTNLRRVVGRFFFGTKQSDEKQLKFVAQKFSAPAKEMNAALMDFGSALCFTRPKCGACPLAKECRYFCEKGKRELQEKKTRRTTMGKKGVSNAVQRNVSGIVVVLHEHHRQYFSSIKSEYRPFFVPMIRFDRAKIKMFFREKYDLEVAVRPPCASGSFAKKRVMVANAQILVGEQFFAVFPKEAFMRYTEKELINIIRV